MILKMVQQPDFTQSYLHMNRRFHTN
uniref:Uncharacterized protein n=1 Tax=Anguilla anguilla TaxID=7936 RepID=A0A0E9QLR6_ANGAN